jgi:hypothetical protein
MALSAPNVPVVPVLPALTPPPITRTRRAHREPLHGLDVAIETTLGADLRMLYGLGIPVVAMVALMIPMFLLPSYWLDAGVLVTAMGATGFIVVKFLRLLEEPDDALDPVASP